MAFDRQIIRPMLAELARQGVFIGTSSWKYPGWRGQLYDEARYVWRGKFAETRFERNCLTEYAEVFKTVCVDAAYYTFPTEKYLQGLIAQVPSDFQFGFKVTDEITVKSFPNLPRFGIRAGRPNENFLNAELFERAFLKPIESIRANVGILIFEFSRFYPSDFAKGSDFVTALDNFLSHLPTDWPCGIEMRNRNWLVPEYFACLARHGVTHVFNSWDAMPSITEQMALAQSRTNPDSVAARYLLKPGRKYEEAKSRFAPYDRTHEVNPEARASAATLIKERKAKTKGKTLIFINNRLEGNALATISAILQQL